LTNDKYTCEVKLLLVCCLELLADEALTRKIMNTKEHEKLVILQQEITIPDNHVHLWFDNLKKVLQESNLAKVFIVLLSVTKI